MQIVAMNQRMTERDERDEGGRERNLETNRDEQNKQTNRRMEGGREREDNNRKQDEMRVLGWKGESQRETWGYCSQCKLTISCKVGTCPMAPHV